MNPSAEQQKNILVCGLGKSGVSTANLALHKGYEVSLSDANEQVLERQEIQDLIKQGASFLSLPLNKPTEFDSCVMSPGISPKSELYQQASKISKDMMGELDFAAQFMLNTKFLAITGTNGKTTCTEMAEHAFRKMGISAMACGNIGLPLAEIALTEGHPEYALVEISSYQIDLLNSLHFSAAVILNITEDHIDRYGSFGKYFDSKLNIENFCEVLITRDDLPTKEQALHFSASKKTADFVLLDNKFYYEGDYLGSANFSFHGKHNMENALAVLALLKTQGFDMKQALNTLSDFRCSEHRLEEVSSQDKVLYINDSKSTNPASLMVAIETFADKKKKIVLIAGGRDKNMDLSVVNPLISKYVREVFSYGECKEKLKTLWQALCPTNLCESFDVAVHKAIQCSKEGDIVLLSPGCSSLDLFKSYEERGHQFKSLVQKVNE
ncbi:UDP-N-acetylmuramoyl-L-alanine--D-glutamate ligase [Lentisphaera marina]|uniref:UDP-N-acetylmuramoyl-L-alanine--D-glutamate ligase n=1 Tax=Lentisphaera marina TaxID=1111041 RepID=UPI0023659C16|nr:UDP-N-acetylmuramoyl-L-alanine--D-glutamate ligase [Lentisphaera marina]MDD7986503.1 UDP-N-acetylmuramoyl-L-alanine--D-glutamate ligase [Lentisphaera marina]